MLEQDLDQLESRGWFIVERVLSPDQRTAIRDAMSPYFARDLRGRNVFEGHDTHRVYALLAKTRAFDELVLHPRVLAVCDALLTRQCLLSAH